MRVPFHLDIDSRDATQDFSDSIIVKESIFDEYRTISLVTIPYPAQSSRTLQFFVFGIPEYWTRLAASHLDEPSQNPTSLNNDIIRENIS